MDLKIGELRVKDHKRAIAFARKGMHFDWYLESRFLLNLYGKYFLYSALDSATQVIAAYAGDELVGLLLAEMEGEEKKYRSLRGSFYVKLFEGMHVLFPGNGGETYGATNREMFARYRQGTSPDGELLFLAADPKMEGKGIGSLLLEELERRERGKTVYLYTDNGCTYQFYERRGFTRAGEKTVALDFGKKKLDLTCFLFSKTFL